MKWILCALFLMGNLSLYGVERCSFFLKRAPVDVERITQSKNKSLWETKLSHVFRDKGYQEVQTSHKAQFIVEVTRFPSCEIRYGEVCTVSKARVKMTNTETGEYEIFEGKGNNTFLFPATKRAAFNDLEANIRDC